MQALRERTGTSPAGRRLLQLLQTTPDRDELARAVLAVLTEGGSDGQDPTDANHAAAPRAAGSAALSTVPDLQFITPRGRFNMELFEDQLLIDMPKQDIYVPYAAIQTVAILDRIPKDTKGRVLLCLHLDRGAKVMNGKTALGCILVQTTAKAVLDIPNPSSSGRLQGPAAVVLSSVLGLLGSPRICAPSLDTFRTSSNEPAVAANIKASTGYLYPMAAGLCFVERPATFIPKDSISSVEFARAGGVSATFDFYVHTKDGASTEFGQLPREELPALSSYVEQQRFAVGAPADDDSDAEEEEANREEGSREEEFHTAGSAPASASGGANGASEDSPEDADESDDEDSDFEPNLGPIDTEAFIDDDDGSSSQERPESEPEPEAEASGSDDEDSDDASGDVSHGDDEAESVDMSDGEMEDMAACAAKQTPGSKRKRRR